MHRDSIPPAVRPQGGTILVIDDNQGIRALIARALKREGYNVLDWADPLEVINYLEQSEEPVALAIVDGVMPQMLGPNVAAEIQRLRPSAPILLMSGHEAPMFADYFGPPGRHFIAKPFVINDLIARVAAIVDRGSGAR